MVYVRYKAQQSRDINPLAETTTAIRHLSKLGGTEPYMESPDMSKYSRPISPQLEGIVPIAATM